MSIDASRTYASASHGYVSQPASHGHQAYPFQKLLATLGVVIGLATSVVFNDFLSGFVIFIGFLCAGALWRRSEIPIFTFCITYQWLFIGVGYFYMKSTGHYPGIRYLGDLDTAIGYSLAGLLSLTVGIRLALRNFQSDNTEISNDYDCRKLFWAVLVLFFVNWLIEITGVQLRLVVYNVAQILHHLMALKYLLLYLLLLTIVQQGRHYWLGIIAFSYVLLPELASTMTKFKELFFLLMIVVLGEWRPFSRDRIEQSRNRTILSIAIVLSIFLLTVGLVWSGGMKHSWRTAITSGQVSGSPIDKISAYGQNAFSSIETFDASRAGESLASRLSSGVAYFSHVLRVVPSEVDHEDGVLTWNAIRHVLMPRFLFPEKPDLGGDSWLVRKYAHLNVAGDESGTSIGMGYMAEFYVDFGFPLMLVPLLVYGLVVGLMYRIIYRLSPSPQIFAAATGGLLLQHFLSYEGNFTKLLGGLVQSFLVLCIILILLGKKVHEVLLEHNR